MSDAIKHECGIAHIRLRKPLQYYIDKYGSATYGLDKLYLLMEKQHNRGQDGAGVATIKLDVPPGQRYISRERSNANQPLKEIFGKINGKYAEAHENFPKQLKDATWVKENLGFSGELLLGHLRYGTHGKNSIENCHPFLRQNNWMTRNLVLAGNFNLTNVDEQFQNLVELGQHPKEKSDTVTVLEKIGHFLDVENQRLFDHYNDLGCSNEEITARISDEMDVGEILRNSAKSFDGGYSMCGLFGNGSSFVIRDPWGIRPCFYYMNDEVVVATSERPVIQTAFNIPVEDVMELEPGTALIINKSGAVSNERIRSIKEVKSCSFERIYFSRGNDKDIYQERKSLGKSLVPAVVDAIGNDFENSVFSFIPNTAEVSFYGMVEGIQDHIRNWQIDEISKSNGSLTPQKIKDVLNVKPRVEKLAIKDAKLRTFISAETGRNDMVAHVYDTTYGLIKRGKDKLVIIDDSIVRGTTLRESILRILDRLGPKKIVVVSSAPQIRFPDCYGIDMSRMKDFVAFQALISLLEKNNMEDNLDRVYHLCKKEEKKHPSDKNIVNHVKGLYKLFEYEAVSKEISSILTAPELNAEVEIIFQTVDGLHEACPNHLGDWYFTGDYPTPGGNRVANRAYINYMEGSSERAY
jgi:amidophosphoribosyltransferase